MSSLVSTGTSGRSIEGGGGGINALYSDGGNAFSDFGTASAAVFPLWYQISDEGWWVVRRQNGDLGGPGGAGIGSATATGFGGGAGGAVERPPPTNGSAGSLDGNLFPGGRPPPSQGQGRAGGAGGFGGGGAGGEYAVIGGGGAGTGSPGGDGGKGGDACMIIEWWL